MTTRDTDLVGCVVFNDYVCRASDTVQYISVIVMISSFAIDMPSTQCLSLTGGEAAISDASDDVEVRYGKTDSETG